MLKNHGHSVLGKGKRNMKVLITGSCGLIGSEAVQSYNVRAKKVIGIDNNMRSQFFGEDGDTTWVRKGLEEDCKNYTH